MIKRDDLVKFFDETLQLEKFSADCSNNGLQIEGKDKIKKVLFAVDACLEVFEHAAENECDMIFVHHGISWGGGIKRWVGADARRFSILFKNGISLYAAHLPLDAHPLYGNNACLADMADLQQRQPFFEYCGTHIGISGMLPQKKTLKEIATALGEILEVEPLLRGDADRIIHSAAIVSGGGGTESISAAKAAGCDLLITGELEHVMHHQAQESGIAVIALGHYASETAGPLAMQQLVAEKFPVETMFAEVPTGL